MKKRRGFISIFILMVTSISMILILYMAHTIKLQTLILNSTKNNVQSFYNSEGKILMCFYDDKYIDGQLNTNLYNAFRNTRFSKKSIITIDEDDLENQDKKSIVRMWFDDIDRRKYIVLSSESDINGTRSNVISTGTVVNDLFEMEIPILDIEMVDTKSLEDLISQIEDNISMEKANISDSMYGFESQNYEEITLTIDKLICTRDTMKEPYVEGIGRREVFIIGKKYKGERIHFNIDKSQSTYKKSLSGIIYVEGDINISTDFQFNGIMIVNGGKLNVEKGINFSVDGMLINLSDEVLYKDNLDIEYNRRLIYKYGTYLPGFVDIKLNLIKSN